MNKQDALKRIAAIEDEAKELRNIVKSCDEQKEWAPSQGEKYFCISNYGAIDPRNFDKNWNYDNKRQARGNMFKTKEEAEKRSELIGAFNRLMNYAKRVNKGSEEDRAGKHYSVHYNLDLSTDWFHDEFSRSPIQFRTWELAEQATIDMEKDFKTFLGVA